MGCEIILGKCPKHNRKCNDLMVIMGIVLVLMVIMGIVLVLMETIMVYTGM